MRTRPNPTPHHPPTSQSEGYANTSPVLLGLADSLARSSSSPSSPTPIGFYQPVAGAPFPGSPAGAPPRHAALLAAAFPGGALVTAAGPARLAVVRALAEGRDEEVIQQAADGFEALAGSGRVAAVVVEGAHEEAAWAAARAAGGAVGAGAGGAAATPTPAPFNLPSIRLALNARLAAALGVRVLVVVDAHPAGRRPHRALPGGSAGPEDAAYEVATRAAVCVRALRRAGADVLGVLVNQGGGGGGGGDGSTCAAALATALVPRLAAAGTRLVGVLPTDPALAAAGLAEVAAALGASPLNRGRRRTGSKGVHAGAAAGPKEMHDAPVSSLYLAAGTAAGMLAGLKRGGVAGSSPPARPVVLADADRGDLVEALAGAGHLHAPAALVLCGVQPRGRSPAGVVAAMALAAHAPSPPSPPPGAPILTTPHAVGDAFLLATTRAPPSLRPASTTKIAAAIALWRASIPAGALEAGAGGATPHHHHPPTDPPARFLARIFASAAAPSQGAAGLPRARIVMPEASDARVLAAAVEVARRGIAQPVLLGREAEVRAAAVAAGLPAAMEGVEILDPASDPAALAGAAARLAAARAHAGLTVAGAAALIQADSTWFGTLLVAGGEADGLVSGAIHTTADTVRPALQLLRGPRAAVRGDPADAARPTPGLVSSLFFMCLPSGVVAFSDCALCVDPTPADLAAIALASAATAEAFGLGGSGGGGSGTAALLPPIRVALLSYSTAASGTGPAVDRVRAAAALAAAAAPPGVAVEGPFQYDAATCPAVAATKLTPAALASSRVAGRANVLVFPSLEAGNIAYKATQAAAGAVVVGPLLQGLALGAANDLSRGCAVPDIVCTVAATVLQARALKARREMSRS
jgi:phosphate acetyltransferase